MKLFDQAYQRIIKEHSSVIINEDLKSTKLQNIMNNLYNMYRDEKAELAKRNVVELIRNIGYFLSDLRREKGSETDAFFVSFKHLLNIAEDKKFKNMNQVKEFLFSDTNLDTIKVNSVPIELQNEIIDQVKAYVDNKIEYLSTDRWYNRGQAEGWQKDFRDFLSQYNVADLDDSQVLVIDDLGKSFNRKIKGQYEVGLACKGDEPRFIVRFNEDGTLLDIRGVASYARRTWGRGSEPPIRWREVQDSCDNMVVFANIQDVNRERNKKNALRHTNRGLADYKTGSFHKNNHSKMTHQEILDDFNNRQREDNINRYRETLEKRKGNSAFTDVVELMESLLGELKYAATDLFNFIKDSDPFDNEQSNYVEFFNLVSSSATLYKNASKDLEEKLARSVEDMSSWSLSYNVEKLNDRIKELNNQLSKVQKAIETVQG